MVNMMIAGF